MRVCCLLCALFTVLIGQITNRKVIIDCDPGVDDSYAIQVLINDPNVEIIAITT